VAVSKLEFPAPKARNVRAQGNALGERVYEFPSAESAKSLSQNEKHHGAFAIIARLQRSGNLAGLYLGRWPRLLHFAPLALGTRVLTQALKCWAIFNRRLRRLNQICLHIDGVIGHFLVDFLCQALSPRSFDQAGTYFEERRSPRGV
jgi:hypothetical protein